MWTSLVQKARLRQSHRHAAFSDCRSLIGSIAPRESVPPLQAATARNRIMNASRKRHGLDLSSQLDLCQKVVNLNPVFRVHVFAKKTMTQIYKIDAKSMPPYCRPMRHWMCSETAHFRGHRQHRVRFPGRSALC